MNRGAENMNVKTSSFWEFVGTAKSEGNVIYRNEERIPARGCQFKNHKNQLDFTRDENIIDTF